MIGVRVHTLIKFAPVRIPAITQLARTRPQFPSSAMVPIAYIKMDALVGSKSMIYYPLPKTAVTNSRKERTRSISRLLYMSVRTICFGSWLFSDFRSVIGHGLYHFSGILLRRSLASSSTPIIRPESSISILEMVHEPHVIKTQQKTSEVDSQGFVGEVGVVFDSHVNHGERKNQSRCEKDPSGDKHVHEPVKVIYISDLYRSNLPETHGVFLASALQAPAPPADWMDLSAPRGWISHRPRWAWVDICTYKIQWNGRAWQGRSTWLPSASMR